MPLVYQVDFKMLLKTDSKYIENVIWQNIILKCMHLKTDKSDVAKRIVSKYAHLKRT